MKSTIWTKPYRDRRTFIGGSDARIIMGNDEAMLVRLWREKRGEVEVEDLSDEYTVWLFGSRRQIGAIMRELAART